MRFLLLIVCAATLLVRPCEAVEYVMEELGALPAHSGSKARSINGVGSIVGISSKNGAQVGSKGNPGSSFVWTNGRISRLDAPEAASCSPSCIDDAGRVAMNSLNGAFVVTGKGMITLKALPGYERSVVYDINSEGISVGACEKNESTVQCPVKWDKAGNPAKLALLVKSSFAHTVGINKFGEIVGYAETADSKSHIFTSASGKTSMLDIEAKAMLTPWDINDSGSIVGTSVGSRGKMDGFVWAKRELETLQLPQGRKGGFAVAVNNKGSVAGWTFDDSMKRHACIWANGMPLELPTPNAKTSEAWDINDAGTVVGFYEDAKGNERAVQWKIRK